MFSITDEHINHVERQLLQAGQVFDEQRREFIKCTHSVDVLACPGSGKTTALVAKLLIIAEQLPLKGNRGVCVLTHTNVAIDTITKKIGGSAGKLFKYPNFFGTIQSFVDKYLAIPAFTERFGKRPDIIDTTWYHAKIDKHKFRYLSRAAIHFCHRSGPKDYPRSIRFVDLQVSPPQQCKALRLNLNDRIDKQIYDNLVGLKETVLQFGVLSYDDAYYLAACYLGAHPSLTALFSLRFPYVFIDEIQDTDSRQIDILNRLFDDSVVMQRIGDINQAIFGFDPKEDEECLWEINEDSKLEITGSKRFSNAIAAVIKYICVRPHDIHPLTGNPEVQNIRPIIIAFEDKHIEKVIDRFADLIFDNQLHLQRDPRFKAVGWRGRSHPSERSIHSYWQGYRKEVQTKRVEYSTLASYIQPQSEGVIGQRSVNYYRKAIILALLKCLRIADRPSTTPLLSESSLFNYLFRENQAFLDKLKLNLAQWCLAIHRKESVLKDLIQYIGGEFSDFFDIRGSTELEQFLTDTALPLPQDVPEPLNIYLHPQYGEQIKIEVCTIHAAKGETHTATLYLETFFRKYDIVRIIDYLKGNHTLPTQKLVRTNLRMAYVGMSRPSHLLCVAVHNANISDHLDKLREAGWQIDTTLVD
ncbi:MAG: UvrD-helicase domain-containing protein [Desulfobaccales bacterium]